MNNDLISRILLRNEFVKYIDVFDLTAWNKINDIIDNAPTVKTYCYFCGQTEHGQIEERPQGDCEKCDFRKFSETFVDGIVEVMNKNGITSVEQLLEILKGGAE